MISKYVVCLKRIFSHRQIIIANLKHPKTYYNVIDSNLESEVLLSPNVIRYLVAIPYDAEEI